MLNELEPPAAAPRRWSRRKILLVFLVPPLLFLGFILVYDERLNPTPDLVPVHPGTSLITGQNGLAMLHAVWDPLPVVGPRILTQWHYTLRKEYLWDDGLVDRLNPSGRNLRQDLTDALAAPEWVEELKTVQDFLANKNDLPNSCFAAMIGSAMQKALAGDRREAISLIRDLRRLAARQFQGAWSWDGLHVAMWRTRQAADLTCDLVAEGGFGEPELAEVASIWEPEDLTWKDFANPTAGEARFLAAIMKGDAGKEYRFGFWERHGEIYPAVSMKLPQFYLGLTIQPNATMNETHRVLRSVRENALATSFGREGSLFAALQKMRPSRHDWSMVLHQNAGGKEFLMSYVIVPSLYLDLDSKLHLFKIRAMRVWISLRRWQLAHEGNLPAALTALVPHYLAVIRPDPWDGSPLRWDAVGKVIYGVGTDWKPDVPLAADLQRQWISVQMNGSLEYGSVALRFELPPPATPAVAYPAIPAASKRKPIPKAATGIK